jgi:hypothetical protein
MRGLSEPVPVLDVFASGLGKIEKLGGGCVRIYLYVLQAPLDGDGPQEKQIVAKFIMPAAALPDSILMLAQAAHDIDGVATALAPEVVH